LKATIFPKREQPKPAIRIAVKGASHDSGEQPAKRKERLIVALWRFCFDRDVGRAAASL
jgi:peptide subunit release factor 1 (eRF1)